MKIAKILVPDPDHMGREVGITKYDPESGIVQHDAFLLDATHTDGLSFNWIEYGGSGSFDEAKQNARTRVIERLNLKPDNKRVLAIMNVGETKAHILKKAGRSINVIHSPTFRNQSHCHIEGLEADDETTAFEMTECVKELLPLGG